MLLPSLVYGLVVVLRNLAFDLRFLRSARVGVPVISVGNITAGGTGKTPLVEEIVGRLIGEGRRVAVVSRGYGRASEGVVAVSDGVSVLVNAREGGDESVQMAMKHPGAIVVVGERRVEAAITAVRDYKAEVVVMDDGFQHRYLHRDLDIVMVDARTDIVSELLLPAGRKREPLRSLRRADAVVFSRTESGGAVRQLRERVAPWFAGPVSFCRHHLEQVSDAATGKMIPLESVRLERLMAFSAIAANDDFAGMLRKLGCDVVTEKGFADHHVFSADDAQTILMVAQQAGARVLLTTEKDFTRLSGMPHLRRVLMEAMPLWYTTVRMQFLQGQKEFDRLLLRAVGGLPA